MDGRKAKGKLAHFSLAHLALWFCHWGPAVLSAQCFFPHVPRPSFSLILASLSSHPLAHTCLPVPPTCICYCAASLA